MFFLSFSCLVAFSYFQYALAQCPQISPMVPIPSSWGEDACKYVTAADLGSGAACPYDYCDFGGITVPLLPTTIQGTPTIDCGAYPTVPTVQSCPTAPLTIISTSIIGGSSSSATSPDVSLPVEISAPSESSIPNSSGPSPPPSAISTPPLLPLPRTPSPPNSGSDAEARGSLSNPTTSSKGGNSGGGGGIGALPNQVTTGGPFSTVSSAFDSLAPSVTSFSYSAGGLIYTKATFTNLTTLQTPSIVSTRVTKTEADSSLATYVGPIVVGTGGVFWDPPGSAPDCIWPFCLSSGPPRTNRGGGGGGGFGCGTNTINGEAGGGGAGGDGDGGEHGGEGSNGQPAPEACPGSRAKSRRSSINSVNGWIVKRAEDSIVSNNPLKAALDLFGTDSNGNGLASEALDGAEALMLNKLPEVYRNGYVTGLTGHYTVPRTLKVGTGDNYQVFNSGDKIWWQVRWDWDPEKGPHVNVQLGKPSSKFAFKLDPLLFKENNMDPARRSGDTMMGIAIDLNNQVGYDMNINVGKTGEPAFPAVNDDETFPDGRTKVMVKLKEYFKSVAKGQALQPFTT